MVDLTRVQAPVVQPTTGSNPLAPDAGYARAAQGIAAGVDNSLTQKAARDKASAIKEGDIALGQQVGEIIAMQEGFLVEEAEARMAREAGEMAAAEGVQLGESGQEVLSQAGRLRRSGAYLQATGQAATRNQLVTMTKLRGLVAQRPDLAKELVTVTNAVSADINAILKTEQDNANSLAAAQRTAEVSAVRGILVQANLWNPDMSYEAQVQLAKQAQHYNYGIAQDKDRFTALEQNAGADRLRFEGQQREVGRIELELKRDALEVLNSSYLPNTTLSINAEVTQQMGEPDANKRLTNLEQLRANRIADAQATLSRFPDQLASAMSQINAQYDRAIPRLSGKQEEDTVTTANRVQTANAWATLLDLNPDLAHQEVLVQKLGPLIEVAFGREKTSEILSSSIIPKLTASMGQSGILVDTRSEERKRSDRKAGIPDPVASSIAVLPGQRPKDVQPQQKRQAARDAAAVLSGASQPDAAVVTPEMQPLAVQTVLSTLDDPIMQSDTAAQNLFVGQLARPETVNAFAGNPNAGLARDSVLKHHRRNERDVIAALEAQYGAGIASLTRIRVLPDGVVQVLPAAGSSIPPHVAGRIEAEMNSNIRALAHVSGGQDYLAAARTLLGNGQ